jgi:antitoxin (DNA-binding transcriptional repressor) of toxin-antitoxin stability system
MEATTKDMRLHARELLAAVDRGEDVIITWRGRKRAKLVRCTDDPHPARSGRNPAFGLWSDRADDVDTQVRSLRQGRRLP